MNWLVVALFIILVILLFGSIIFNIAFCYVIYRGYLKFNEQEVQMYYISEYIKEILKTCNVATKIFQNSLVKTIGENSIPQYNQLHHDLKTFEITLETAITAMTDLKTSIDENLNE